MTEITRKNKSVIARARATTRKRASKSKSKRDRASNSKRLKTIARENQKGARSSDQEQGLARERENT